MKNNLKIRLPSSLDLGTVLPGHYGEEILQLLSENAAFLDLSFTQKSLRNGFFIMKQDTSQCLQSINMVLKSNKKAQIFVGCFPRQVSQSMQIRGQLIVRQGQSQAKIKLIFKIQVPKIFCKKMLADNTSNMKMIRLVVNKAVTSDVRIPLFNSEQYTLQLTPGLLVKSSISDKQNPFILKTQSSNIKAQAKQQFFVIVSINTNIGYKNEHKGLKKIIFRNVLTLNTNSSMIWCLPLQIIVIFVKQPQFKTDQ